MSSQLILVRATYSQIIFYSYSNIIHWNNSNYFFLHYFLGCHAPGGGKFYGQLQKQLTEAVKRLLGLTDLSLWKSNSASVVELVDEETICFRIAYFYANPASANLVGRIEKYPGLSSWKEFKRNLNAIDAASTTTHAWIRLPMIEKLRSLNVSAAEDHDICAKWLQDATEYHDFTIYPNAWMEAFNIEGEEQVRATNKKILLYVRLLQKNATAKRIAENKTIMHPTVLAQQPIDMTYIPKKPSRRIVTYSLEPKVLSYLLEQYEIFCEECAKCYESWKQGDFSVEWPEGALKPPFPNTQNDFGDPIQVPDWESSYLNSVVAGAKVLQFFIELRAKCIQTYAEHELITANYAGFAVIGTQLAVRRLN